MKLVVDTSVALKWFAPTESDHKDALWYSFISDDLIVPDLIYAEMTSALKKKVECHEIGDEQARAVLSSLPSYFSECIASSSLAQTAFDLSATLGHPVFDCFFLALAMDADGRQLLTADLGFVRKIVGKGFGEYCRVVGSWVPSSDLLGPIPADLDGLSTRLAEVEHSIRRQLQGTQITFLTERICNLPVLEPQTERSKLQKFKKNIFRTDRDSLRKIISICWYGRPLATDTLKQMYHDAGELTSDPEYHAFYIASLLPYFDRGIERFKAAH